jgi:hypothetical protein
MKSDDLEQRFHEALVDEYGPVSLSGALSAVAPFIFEARAKKRTAKVRWGRLAEILSRGLRARGRPAISADTLRGMASRLAGAAMPDRQEMPPQNGRLAPSSASLAARADSPAEGHYAERPRYAKAAVTEDTGDRIARILDNLKEVEKSRRADPKR